ncbi:hypothetical protein [Streptomyces sp. cg35]|uniref:hypothetical protein n=1 Tax=Streptomyces sp. cg35 TaxID=3421650 RepID=UPI003D16F2E4
MSDVGFLLYLLSVVFVSSIGLLAVKVSLVVGAPKPFAITVGVIVGAVVGHYVVKFTTPAAERG